MAFDARVLFFLLLIFFCPLLAQAQSLSSSGIQVSADDMERDSVKGIIILKGNVNVTFKDQILNSDKATIYLGKQTVIAEGNVILQSLTTHIEGSKIEFDYDKNTGLIYNGYLKSGQVVFEGSMIEKLGENEYIATDGRYTACETCPPAWSFSGKSIHAELGGYAKISQPIMRVGGVPVIWLPGIIVPLKSQRQTGFLTPSLIFSTRSGTGVSQDFFWAISRSQDLTLDVATFDKLGIKSGAEYRYVLSENSEGFLKAGHVRDRIIKTEEPNYITKDFDRWFVKYRHHYELPENYTHRLLINSASDTRYPRDFPVDLDVSGDPALENKMSITKNTKNQHFSIEATMFTNLLKADPTATNEDAVHRFPEIRYFLKENRILDTDFLIKAQLNYTNFGRSGLSYDNIVAFDDTLTLEQQNECFNIHNNDPKFTPPSYCVTQFKDGNFNVTNRGLTGTNSVDTGDEPKDLIRTGQRLDISPTISYPFQLAKVLSITPSVTYRETQYKFDLSAPVNQTGDYEENYSTFAAQRYVQTDLVARTSFARVYAGESGGQLSANRLKHEIEPEIGYSRIPWIRRPKHGFFGDLAGKPYYQSTEPISDEVAVGEGKLQFDYLDRTFDQNLINFQVTNRLTRKTWRAGSPEYKEIASLTLRQTYDYNEAKDPQSPQPWSAISALLDIKTEHFETYTVSTYYPYAAQNNISSRVRILDGERDYLQLGYVRSVRVTSENTITPKSLIEQYSFGPGLTTRYLDIGGYASYNNVSNKFIGWTSEILIKPPGNCWAIMLQAHQAFGNEERDIDFKFNASFNYGGETEGPRPL